jgi:RNA polymerase sigma-70 factor (ECF subfamily)
MSTSSSVPPRGPASLNDPLAALLLGSRERWVAFVQRRAPADVDAEDVVHRAFERALRHTGELRDPARVVAWFYRILRRELADVLSARGAHLRATQPDGEQVLAEQPAPPSAEEVAAACGCVARLLDTLRPEYAAVLRRVALEDAPLRVVARELAITENNAAVRLHRARGALRRELADCCGVDSLRACLDCTCEIDGRCGRHRGA